MKKHYDYIIAGAGASGLSLAWKLLQSPLSDKNVLIVDNELEAQNDKTWCFWDSNSPPFSDIIHRSWQHVEVSTFGTRFVQALNEYPYYCLRSIDFTKKILSELARHDNFTLLQRRITKLTSTPDGATLHTEDQSFDAEYIFQSCFAPSDDEISSPRYPLLQHFLGWEITISKPVFDEATFTLMDFDETFSGGIAFIYLLPWSKHSGLVEYTIFSNQLAAQSLYEEKLSLYLNNRFNLQPIDYEIQRRELGKIPMQDRISTPWYGPNILNLGIVRGLTKPSTGYTFKRIQDQCNAILRGLMNNGIPQNHSPSERRYKAYDLWLLQIMHDHPKDALNVFNHLFQNRSMDEVFRFLGEETSFLEDLQIMNSVPYIPFLRAMWKTRGRLQKL